MKKQPKTEFVGQVLKTINKKEKALAKSLSKFQKALKKAKDNKKKKRAKALADKIRLSKAERKVLKQVYEIIKAELKQAA